MKTARLITLLAVVCLSIACGQRDSEETAALVDVTVQTADLTTGDCSGRFVPHELDHITTNAYKPIDMYDSNGAGVAVGDLDGDGDADIVLANLAGDHQLFWNEGDFVFRSQSLQMGNARSVAMVDVDTDGLLDVVFATRMGSLSYWHNKGEQQLKREPLTGVREHAYAMAWADLDGDLDLDLVTGSYDTALERELRDSFLFSDGAGVFYYENTADGFVPTRLIDTAQALAMQLLDINGDGLKDILVGNDFFTVRDYVFLATTDEDDENQWVAAEPFATTTENTMSFDIGDINNDGQWELFAVDMQPYADEPDTDITWSPVLQLMLDNHVEIEGDPQIMANVLQVRDEQGNLVNEAAARGAAYTGWSWSSKFGDLDQDGFVDIYSVNGMASAQTFGHLPDFTLVEENQALRNDGSGRFSPAPQWGLTDTKGGRGMSMVDLDNDGDLDIVINNLLAKASVWENQLCTGHSVQVDLVWPGSPNPFAVGAVVQLHTGDGIQMRDVRVSSGYLSGDAPRLHFGVAAGTPLEQITVTWPDGLVSAVALENETENETIESNRLVRIERPSPP